MSVKEKASVKARLLQKPCAAALAIALSACVAQQAPDLTRIGSPPPANFDPEPAIRQALGTELIDAESARFRRVGGPVPGRARPPIIVGGPTVEGWGYCYLVNAKNRLGGYTSYQPIYVVFSGTHVAGWAQNAELSTWNCF
jgi:hypothetical protein